MEQLKQPGISFPQAEPKRPLSKPPMEATRALLELICTSRLPFAIVSDPSFQHFVSAVQKHPNWQIPHRTTLASEELDKLHKEVMFELKEEFKTCKHVALTVDLCAGKDGTSYFAITCSALDDKIVLHETVLACVPAHSNHNGANLAEITIAVLREIGLDEKSVVAVVADEGGGAHCVADFFPNAVRMLCSAHRLQTALRNAFESVYTHYPLLESILRIAKHLASLFNTSNIVRAEIQVLQSILSESVSSLVQDVVTRWLSQYKTFKSLQQHEGAVKVWIAEKLTDDPAMADYNAHTFWPLLNILVDILEPFATVTELFSTESKPSMHFVVESILFLKTQLISLHSSLQRLMLSDIAKSSLAFFLNSLSASLDEKFSNKWNDLEVAAFALFPDNRLPNSCPSDSAESELLEKGYQAIQRLLSSVMFTSTSILNSTSVSVSPYVLTRTCSSPTDSTAILQGRLLQKRQNRILPTVSLNELEEYKVVPMLDENETFEQFWYRLGPRFPTLAALVRLVFSVPCSQTASERLFSLLRLTCGHLRGRMHAETVNKLLTSCVYINRRNAALEKVHIRPRSEANIEADSNRIASLIENNKKRKREIAEMIDSAAEISQIDVQAVLESLRLPTCLPILSADTPVPFTNAPSRLFESDDGELPNDEDYVPRKQAKLGESMETDEEVLSGRTSPGECHIKTSPVSDELMLGHWKCSTSAKPTPHFIFGQKNLKFINFLRAMVVEDSPSIDADGNLHPNFVFKLNDKGNKKFKSSRRSFISEVGCLKSFGP